MTAEAISTNEVFKNPLAENPALVDIISALPHSLRLNRLYFCDLLFLSLTPVLLKVDLSFAEFLTCVTEV